MATPTYTPIATITLASTASSVTFSSIPGTYRDLVLIANYAGTSGGYFQMQFNSDATMSNYARVYMVGTSSNTTASSADSSSNFAGFSTNRGMFKLQVFDYSATDKHKTILNTENDGASQVAAQATRWGNTAAITSFAIATPVGDIASGSTFSLYGISA